MSDDVSVIDAIKAIAKATKEDTCKVSDMVKGALHPDQIDDLRIMLSRAREGTVVRGAATTAAATSAAATSSAGAAQRRAMYTSVQKNPGREALTRASAKFQGRHRAPQRGTSPHYRLASDAIFY